MQIDWTVIRADTAGAAVERVELTGWMVPPDLGAASSDYFLLLPEAPCCGPCVPRDPCGCVEVHAARSVPLQSGPLRVRGRLERRASDDAPGGQGWRYRLVSATAVDASPRHDANGSRPPLSRRAFLASGAALGLAACASGASSGAGFGVFSRYTDSPAGAASQPGASDRPASAWVPSADAVTLDMHSHAGRVIVSRDPAIGARRPFVPVAAPMRAGGMKVICLAIVTDTTVTRVSANRLRFEPWRTPEPGELYALGQTEFARAKQLLEREQMPMVLDSATLASHAAAGPCAIIAAEGADFLEGQIDRVDEAYSAHGLRHLQLTHYRVNELGDIQTEPPVHGGLTDFGADVVRRCNTLGIVVDVAHGTYDLVKRAASVTTKPLVLSHTALAAHPGERSRRISPDHARAIADTGGVIGVWPSSGTFHSLDAMAEGMKRLADLVGVDHVGLGSDLFGFISPPVFRSYEQLPSLGDALLRAGFSQPETERVLGGNYRRVFEASVGWTAG